MTKPGVFILIALVSLLTPHNALAQQGGGYDGLIAAPSVPSYNSAAPQQGYDGLTAWSAPQQGGYAYNSNGYAAPASGQNTGTSEWLERRRAEIAAQRAEKLKQRQQNFQDMKKRQEEAALNQARSTAFISPDDPRP